jgi:hypothetical protein
MRAESHIEIGVSRTSTDLTPSFLPAGVLIRQNWLLAFAPETR